MGWVEIENMDLIVPDGTEYGLKENYRSRFPLSIGVLISSNGSEYFFEDVYTGLVKSYSINELKNYIYKRVPYGGRKKKSITRRKKTKRMKTKRTKRRK